MNFSIKELNELIYSLGITALNGRMLDKELNQSLMEKLHAELAYQMSLEVEDEHIEIEHSNSHWNHFVTNEEADEDYRASMVQDEQRYEDKQKRKGVTQSLLDYVEFMGSASYTEMHNYYRTIFGSNSFSHILKSLIVPYKNRHTRRYLVKDINGKYIVKLANPSNWVVKDYDLEMDNFKTFNEAPYGDD